MTGIVLGCGLAVVACGGGSPTSPSAGTGGTGVFVGDRELQPGEVSVANGPFTIRAVSDLLPGYPQTNKGFGGFEFSRPGRLTVKWSYEPAATQIQLRLVHESAFVVCRPLPPVPAGCTVLYEGVPGSSPQEFEIDPLPALSGDESFSLQFWLEGGPDIQGNLEIWFYFDPNAPGVPLIGGTWDVTVTLTGPTTCGDRAFSGLLDLGLQQGSATDFSGSILNTDSLQGLQGRLESDGTFVLAGEVTPLSGERNEIRGVSREVTFTGQFSGASMSGSVSQRFADGCTSTGTFSGNKQ